MERLTNHGLFDKDTSALEYAGKAISLNVRARACKAGGKAVHVRLGLLPGEKPRPLYEAGKEGEVG